MQEASKFRGLYTTEKEKLLDVESDLKDCKVIYILDYTCFQWEFVLNFQTFMIQRNLDNTNKELHDLKENYIQVISKLKEREAIISRMKASGNNSSSYKNIKAFDLCYWCFIGQRLLWSTVPRGYVLICSMRQMI